MLSFGGTLGVAAWTFLSMIINSGSSSLCNYTLLVKSNGLLSLYLILRLLRKFLSLLIRSKLTLGSIVGEGANLLLCRSSCLFLP